MGFAMIGTRVAALRRRGGGADRPRARVAARERLHAHPAPAVRICAACGGVAVLFCTAALVALHLLPATSHLDPLSQPLSKYALTSDGGLFDSAVLVLALGVLAMLAALLIDRRAHWPLAAALASCAAGLVVLVACPDVTGAGGLTAVGWAHWTASMVAFGVMPVAPLRMWARHRVVAGSATGCATLPALSGGAGALAYGWFAVLIVGNVLVFTTDVPLWLVGGLIERMLATTELAAAFLLAAWIWRGCRCSRGRGPAAPLRRTAPRSGGAVMSARPAAVGGRAIGPRTA